MGSYGAKWRHGWIPLNAAATALKLKRLKAGSSEGFHGEHAGHSIHVGAIHGDDTRHAALVVNPKTGRGHYSVHANSDTAYQAAHEHAMRLQDRLTKREAAREIVSQRIGGSADKGMAAQRGERVHAERAVERVKRAKDRGFDATGKRAKPFKASEEAKVTLPSGYRIGPKTNDNYDLYHNGKRIRVSADRDSLVGYAGDHAKGDVSAHPKTAQDAIDAAKKTASSFSKQEMMLPGVRERNGEHIIVRPSAKMHNAGHRFPEVGVFSPMVEHDQFGVEHGNGAHIGHIDTNGGLHITGPGMERHQVSNVNQAVAGLHANYTIRERERAAAKTAEQAKAASEKEAQTGIKAQRDELAALAHRVAATHGVDRHRQYNYESKLVREVQGSHEEKRAALKAMVRKHSAADLQPDALFKMPKSKPKPRVTKADSPTMQANRDKVQRALERSPLSLSNGNNVTEAPPVGTPVEHGGRAGHVVGVYGSTFDTYHPPTEGANGFYMRHHIVTRRGKKRTESNFGGHSSAKAS